MSRFRYSLVPYILIKYTVVSLLFSKIALADVATVPSTMEVDELKVQSAYNGWSSAISFGFAGDRKEWSKKDEMVTGSVLFLDLIKNFKDRYSVGIRSMGTGGKLNGEEQYRLGSGPFVGAKVWDDFTVKLAGGYFSESSTNTRGQRVFESKGIYAQLEWGRVFKVWDNLDIVWSAFLVKYWGSVHSTNVALVKQKPVLELKSDLKYSDINRNEGTQSGMIVSIRMNLDK